jgi:hypothetical protein
MENNNLETLLVYLEEERSQKDIIDLVKILNQQKIEKKIEVLNRFYEVDSKIDDLLEEIETIKEDLLKLI